jgi:aspartate aminotransferase
MTRKSNQQSNINLNLNVRGLSQSSTLRINESSNLMIREGLNKNEIFTSAELCKRLLEETGVAILPGYDFGRQPEELTARIAYVDFNGEEALKASQSISLEVELNQDFINSYCPNLMRAADIISEWIKNF